MIVLLLPVLHFLFHLIIGGEAQVLPQANCTHPTKFFDQLIEHDGSSTQTFKQQYQLIMDYYEPGGPILYLQSAEGSNLSCVETYVLSSWAPQLGAAIALLEHRFFGASWPSTDPNSKTRYQSLSLDNVLSDAVSFINFVKKSDSRLNNAKTIVHGGSYGGWLSALLRLNYPDVFYGSIAWAAPVAGLGPDQSTPERFNWWLSLHNIYCDQSAEAAAKIKTALATFAGYLKTGTDYNKLKADLNLCTTPKNTTDLSVIMKVIMNAYTTNAQFSYGLTAAAAAASSNTLPKAINRTLVVSGDMDVLNATLGVAYPLSCVDWETSNNYDQAGVGADTFTYLSCRYFPLNADSVPPDTIWPVGVLDVGSSESASCLTSYNITIPNEQELELQYHFTTDNITSTPRILFTMGEIDPTTGYGPLYLLSRMTADRNASRAIMVGQGAHTEEAFTPLAINKTGVLYAQNVQLQMITEWLGMV